VIYLLPRRVKRDPRIARGIYGCCGGPGAGSPAIGGSGATAAGILAAGHAHAAVVLAIGSSWASLCCTGRFTPTGRERPTPRDDVTTGGCVHSANENLRAVTAGQGVTILERAAAWPCCSSSSAISPVYQRSRLARWRSPSSTPRGLAARRRLFPRAIGPHTGGWDALDEFSCLGAWSRADGDPSRLFRSCAGSLQQSTELAAAMVCVMDASAFTVARPDGRRVARLTSPSAATLMADLSYTARKPAGTTRAPRRRDLGRARRRGADEGVTVTRRASTSLAERGRLRALP